MTLIYLWVIIDVIYLQPFEHTATKGKRSHILTSRSQTHIHEARPLIIHEAGVSIALANTYLCSSKRELKRNPR